MVKMMDVASEAGVSIKTVSRVLNNEPHVTEALRNRVFKAVKDLNYIPSASARNLRSSRTYTLHLIANSMQSNYVNAIQSGALKACQRLGYNLHWTALDKEISENATTLKNWCSEFISKKRPDGVILLPPYANHDDVNLNFNSLNVPIVRIGPNDIVDNQTTVKINDQQAAFEATQYLIDTGHKCIAFIRGIEDQDATHERFKGYHKALVKNGIQLDKNIIFQGEFSFESGMKAGETIIAQKNRPTAVFAANDDMAVGVIVAAHKNNLQIPKDIAIIGFDDSEMAEKIWPALTTTRQPRAEFGECAVETLAAQIGKKSQNKPNTILMDYEFLIRESSGENIV